MKACCPLTERFAILARSPGRLARLPCSAAMAFSEPAEALCMTDEDSAALVKDAVARSVPVWKPCSAACAAGVGWAPYTAS